MTKHTFDPTSFIFGLVFTVIGIAFYTHSHVYFRGLSWLAAIIPLAIGLAFISSAVQRASNNKSS